jgi:hypothetical protein
MLAPSVLFALLAAPASADWPLDLRRDCPSDGKDIIVCGRRSDPERYRLAPDPRRAIDHPIEHGWGDLSRDMDDLSQSGLPGTNSAVGSGGQTGQRAGMVRDYKRWKDARSDDRE